MRILFILISFFFVGWDVAEDDRIGASMWAMIFLLNLGFYISDEIKSHVDKKFNELKDTL